MPQNYDRRLNDKKNNIEKIQSFVYGNKNARSSSQIRQKSIFSYELYFNVHCALKEVEKERKKTLSSNVKQ